MTENYKENEINWIDNLNCVDWRKIKGITINKLQENNPLKWFFLAHYKNTVYGKPQLISEFQKTIPLIRLFEKKDKKDNCEYYFKFFDENIDKRSSGFQIDAFTKEFWIYRTNQNGIEYYILSKTKLPNCSCSFKGMIIDVNDFAEINYNLKLDSFSKILLLKDFKPELRILSKKELIEFTKSQHISETEWLDYLAYNKLRNYNRLPMISEKLKSLHILSGKKDGYPLHLFIMGKSGRKKTSGYIETTAYKFDENLNVCEGGNSRIKGLIPSFKDKPAKIGYLCECERMGFVDEIGKMIEKEKENHERADNSLGDINFILEHKNRKVKSGNEDLEIQATAKFIFVTNPIGIFSTIHQHVGLIDPSTLSRFFIWIQGTEESEFTLKKESISYNPLSKNKIKISKQEFLNIFDSCYNFLCNINEEEIEKLLQKTLNLDILHEPMKSSVWNPRALHHIYLIVDGLCKHRCLFKDYDLSFKANKEDYEEAEKILIQMINNWNTNLSSKFTGF